MIQKEVLLQFMEEDDLLKSGTPRNRILKLCFRETMGSWTAVRPGRKPALDAFRTRLGRGQRGLGRVARNYGLYAKWCEFLYNRKIYNGLRVDLLGFRDFEERFANFTAEPGSGKFKVQKSH
jgi:hypothetical protein